MRSSLLLLAGLAASVCGAPVDAVNDVVVTETVTKVVVVTVEPTEAPPTFSASKPVVVVLTSTVFATPQKPLTTSCTESEPALSSSGPASESSAFSSSGPVSESSAFDLSSFSGAVPTSTLSFESSTQAAAATIVPGSCEDVHPHDVQYCSDIEESHNRHRRNHSSVDIHWDPDLYHSALDVANTCNFTHQSLDGGNYGQNLALGTSKINVQQAITNGFYNSEFNYFLPQYYGMPVPTDMIDPNGPATWEHYAHFTQVIWNASTRVGCATIQCQQLGCTPNYKADPPTCTDGILKGDYGGWFTVCNYRTAGNFKPFFDTNVFEPLGHDTVTVPDVPVS